MLEFGRRDNSGVDTSRRSPTPQFMKCGGLSGTINPCLDVARRQGENYAAVEVA
jgi:hypothetical protein